jgi:hypothetical protein
MPVNAKADKIRHDFDRAHELHVKQKLTRENSFAKNGQKTRVKPPPQLLRSKQSAINHLRGKINAG